MAAMELERALLLLTPGPLSVATGNCISLFTEALTAADGDFAGGSLPERYFPDNEIAASYAVHKQRARSSSAKSSSVESRSDESNSPARDLPESVPESDASESVDSGLADQRSRFQIWSANIGARDVGTSSLEYKLRDASDISHTVLDTLVDLAQLLQDYIAIVKGDVVPWDQLPGEESEMIDEDAPATEVEQITLHIKEVVESLLGLSATVQHPAPRDFTAFLAANTALNETRDMNHVQELYPKLLHWQAEKLAGALSRIRQYLRYRQNSRTKSTLGAGEDQDRKGKRKVPSTFDLPTPRSKTPAESSQRQSDGHGDPEDTLLPSYTSSAGQQRIPPLPQEARLGPFECPICCCFVFFQDEIKWKTHVIRDLQPYVSSSFKAHVGNLHADDLTVYGMAALLSLAKVERKWTDLDCPFCCVSQHSAAIYFQHVGRHMEKLSLFALPLVGNDVAGVTDEQEGASSTFQETSLGFESFPYSDTRSVSDFDDEDSNGSETSHEDFGNTDERQEVVDNAKERELQSALAQLRPAVSEGNIDTVQRILLETSIPDDPKSMFLAARAGHHLVIQLLLETGFKPDPCIPLKGPRNHFATPMLAAIGQSNLQVVKVLAAANGFDPTRTRFDGRLYHEIARERRGPNWLEEENILKIAYESYRRVASSSQGV